MSTKKIDNNLIELAQARKRKDSTNVYFLDLCIMGKRTLSSIIRKDITNKPNKKIGRAHV